MDNKQYTQKYRIYVCMDLPKFLYVGHFLLHQQFHFLTIFRQTLVLLVRIRHLPDDASLHLIQLQGFSPKIKISFIFMVLLDACVAVKRQRCERAAHLISFSVSSLFIMFLSSEVNMSEKLKILTEIVTSILPIKGNTQSKANMGKNRLFCLSKRDYF